MFRKMLMKERRTAQLYTLIIFIVLSAVFFSITFFLQLNANQMKRLEIEINERSVINTQRAMITSDLRGRISDLLYIADTLSLREYQSDNYPLLTEQWIAFSNRKKFYDQIRYIDHNGDEIIRVNYTADGAYAVPANQLQNKGDRNYFSDAIKLQNSQIYMSRLDLNIENGEIEQPIKPMLRLATPMFDRDGTPEGIVILNYSADNTFVKAVQIATSSAGEILFLNTDGYWVYNSGDRSKEWAFMYDDRLGESFANEYPSEWEAITNSAEGILESEAGTFIFSKLILDDIVYGDGDDVSLICTANTYYLVSYIPADTGDGAAFSGKLKDTALVVLEKYLSIYFLLSGIAFVMAAYVAVNKGQKKEIKYFSEYDTLTGIYNRRSAYEKMQELKKGDTKSCRLFAVCFIDINGLKEVNDTLGHDAGDELIKTVVQGIQRSIRDHDFVARLGGDEFLIVFDGLLVADAEKVWERITQYYAQVNEQENRAYRISASHGIGVFTCDEAISVDHIINQADEKMYLEKREIKKTLQVLRNKTE